MILLKSTIVKTMSYRSEFVEQEKKWTSIGIIIGIAGWKFQ